mmetsp:Transcript_38668/g.103134  ORF Transcript_38668/g.103134 Transcript_38668/m.103134 type:complete len:260 (+) Transcript_38668:85-864(+)
MWNLSHEETVQHSVRQLGGLKPIINLLSSDSPLIRFNAVGALPLLTEQSDNVHECVELGAIPPLVHLLATETNVLVLQNAAQSLGNIAEGCQQYQQAIAEVQGLKRLVDVITLWAAKMDEQIDDDIFAKQTQANSQELLAKCCFAVWLICQKHEANQLIFAESGGLQAIIGLLAPGSEETLLELAGGATCALCESNDPNKERFREEGGLEPLIALLVHENDAVKLNSAKALCHLAENEENRKIIRELGGLEKLVHLLSH